MRRDGYTLIFLFLVLMIGLLAYAAVGLAAMTVRAEPPCWNSPGPNQCP